MNGAAATQNCLENTTAHIEEYRTNVETDGTENGNHFVVFFVQTVQFEQIIYLAQSMTL